MIPVLEHPDIRRRAMPISVASYHWMQQQGLVAKRAELIRGVIVEKTSKSPLHTDLTIHLQDLLEKWSAGRYFVRKEDPLTLADSEPEPDVSVVTGSRGDYRRKHPSTALLVVEVSVSSESADREMLAAYAEAGVAEVWLVLGNKQQIERFSHPADGRYAESRLFSMGETLDSTSLSGFSLTLATLFADE